MSYHYRDKTLQEKKNLYQEYTKQIESNKKQLEMKQLEAEFYQDKNNQKPTNKNLSLADQIMNQLISNPSQVPNRYVAPPPKQLSPYRNPKAQQYIPYQEIRREQYKPSPQPQRQNHFINERQLQKNKLQNQKHQGLFPTSNDHNKVRSYGKQQQQPTLVPENDRHNSKNGNQPVALNNNFKAKSPDIQKSYNPNFNPFVKDDDLQKQKKEEMNRKYLMELEEQRFQQLRKKQERIKQEKQFKGQHYEFNEEKKIDAKPLVMKRHDPNSSKPPVPSMGNYSAFDKTLVKSKIIELKSKFKKGKVTYQEYTRQLNNLQKNYGGDIIELEQDNAPKAQKQFAPVQYSPIKKQQQLKIASQPNVQENKNQPNISYPIRNESINYSQFMPSMVQQPTPYYANGTLPPNSMVGYGMPPAFPPQNVSGQYMQMMKKIFDVCIKQIKEAYQTQYSQGQAYQQALNKIISQTQTNFLTQQIPPIQNIQQKQFYSDAKQHKDYFDKQSNVKRQAVPVSGQSLNNQMPYGQSDNSQYYDKSLSAIASKIPINNTTNKKYTKQQKTSKQSALDQFFKYKYKVRRFHTFQVMIDPNQSSLEVPSTSTYFRSKNAKEQLKHRFEQDLLQLKKLQSQKGFTELANKMNKNATYEKDRRVLVDPIMNPVQSQYVTIKSTSPHKIKRLSKDKPFLKKVTSNDQNIMTFNQKQPRMNSPIGNYSPKSKKQILEQDEYQTQPRIRQESKVTPSYIQQYQKRINQGNIAPIKALNFIKLNNDILSKYDKQKTQENNKYITIKDSQIKESKINENNSKDYFSNNQISPVKKSDNYYEQSLETIRSDYEPAKVRTPKVGASIQGFAKLQAVNPSKASQSQSQLKMRESQKQRMQEDMMRYSQTVESVEESSNTGKPPINKRKSVGKKKESSIMRSKMNPDISKSYNMNQSIESYGEPHKFDSNVYESQYESGVNLNKNKVINSSLADNKSKQKKQKSPQLEFNPPTIIAPRSVATIPQSNPYQQIKASSSKLLHPQGKLKSLEQARKLAKQCKVKSFDESKDYRSVQQKFSELQSFITRKDDSIQLNKRQIQNVQQKRKSPQKQKKDVMKLLQQLQGSEDQYNQQFQSYREQSQQYQ